MRRFLYILSFTTAIAISYATYAESLNIESFDKDGDCETIIQGALEKEQISIGGTQYRLWFTFLGDLFLTTDDFNVYFDQSLYSFRWIDWKSFDTKILEKKVSELPFLDDLTKSLSADHIYLKTNVDELPDSMKKEFKRTATTPAGLTYYDEESKNKYIYINPSAQAGELFHELIHAQQGLRDNRWQGMDSEKEKYWENLFADENQDIKDFSPEQVKEFPHYMLWMAQWGFDEMEAYYFQIKFFKELGYSYEQLSFFIQQFFDYLYRFSGHRFYEDLQDLENIHYIKVLPSGPTEERTYILLKNSKQDSKLFKFLKEDFGVNGWGAQFGQDGSWGDFFFYKKIDTGEEKKNIYDILEEYFLKHYQVILEFDPNFTETEKLISLWNWNTFYLCLEVKDFLKAHQGLKIVFTNENSGIKEYHFDKGNNLLKINALNLKNYISAFNKLDNI